MPLLDLQINAILASVLIIAGFAEDTPAGLNDQTLLLLHKEIDERYRGVVEKNETIMIASYIYDYAEFHIPRDDWLDTLVRQGIIGEPQMLFVRKPQFTELDLRHGKWFTAALKIYPSRRREDKECRHHTPSTTDAEYLSLYQYEQFDKAYSQFQTDCNRDLIIKYGPIERSNRLNLAVCSHKTLEDYYLANNALIDHNKCVIALANRVYLVWPKQVWGVERRKRSIRAVLLQSFFACNGGYWRHPVSLESCYVSNAWLHARDNSDMWVHVRDKSDAWVVPDESDERVPVRDESDEWVQITDFFNALPPFETP